MALFAVPPDIWDMKTSTDVVAQDGADVSLSCAATGYPAPTISWRREHGATILRRGSGEEGKPIGCQWCVSVCGGGRRGIRAGQPLGADPWRRQYEWFDYLHRTGLPRAPSPPAPRVPRRVRSDVAAEAWA